MAAVVTKAFNPIIIPGIPFAQERIRVSTQRGYPVMYDPKKSRDAKQRIRQFLEAYLAEGMDPELSANCPFELTRCLRLEWIFYLPRPKTVPFRKRRFPNVKPDVDNYIKGNMDALVPSVLVDDRIVIDIDAKKVYLGDYPEDSTLPIFPCTSLVIKEFLF
jgi:Holliday junction resolvase RusA-like endonuclease